MQRHLLILPIVLLSYGCSSQWEVVRQEESISDYSPIRYDHKVSILTEPTKSSPIFEFQVMRLPFYRTEKRDVLRENRKVEKWPGMTAWLSAGTSITALLVSANENNTQETVKNAKEVAKYGGIAAGFFGLIALSLPSNGYTDAMDSRVTGYGEKASENLEPAKNVKVSVSSGRTSVSKLTDNEGKVAVDLVNELKLSSFVEGKTKTNLRISSETFMQTIELDAKEWTRARMKIVDNSTPLWDYYESNRKVIIQLKKGDVVTLDDSRLNSQNEMFYWTDLRGGGWIAEKNALVYHEAVTEVKDTKPPHIRIIEPELYRGDRGMKKITESTILIRGKAIDESGIQEVSINNMESHLSANGDFWERITLKAGENRISVKALDTKSNRSEKSFVLNRELVVATPVPLREGSDYALLFATNEYDEWNELVNPIYDAKTIQSELENHYGFKCELIENPTQEMIYSKLREYTEKKYLKDDQLFIFFAGHGHFDDSFKLGFLVAKDSRLNDQFKKSYIAHLQLRIMLDNISCNHIMLMMDACFGGTFDPLVAIRGREPDLDEELPKEAYIARKLKHKTRLVLTSGGKEYVPDGRPGQHSPFTRRVLEAFRSLGGENSILTFAELLVFVDRIRTEVFAGQFESNEPGSDFIFIAR